jgi:hypothetical protein
MHEAKDLIEVSFSQEPQYHVTTDRFQPEAADTKSLSA